MIKEYDGTLYGRFRQNKFSDIYPDAATFINDYKGIGLPPTITDTSAQNLFYLLYGSYGNSVVAAADTTRFKYRLFSIIWQYGPTWEKELSIQKEVRELTPEEIETGGVQIQNLADNPSVTPSTSSSEYLEYIKQQNTTIGKKGKLESYALLLSLLKTDVTQEFINRFKSLFLTIIEPEDTLLYENIGDY